MDQMRDQFTALINAEEQFRSERVRTVHRTAYEVIATALGAALVGGILLALSSRRQLIRLSTEFAGSDSYHTASGTGHSRERGPGCA